MSHYQFHICENGLRIEDDMGQDFQDSDQVRREAVATGASIARDLFTNGSAHRVVVQVDEDGVPFMKVSISLDVEDQRPPPGAAPRR